MMADGPSHGSGDVTRLLRRAGEGDEHALDRIFPLVYDELQRIARAQLGRERGGHTLQATALVNEAYLKLVRGPPAAALDRAHFLGIAARAMRQVLVEAARRRQAEKRGGPEVSFVTFDDALDGAHATAGELLDLDEALDELARLDARQARVVEARFFGGLDVMETAELLGVSEATVMRDWRAARAWLAVRLNGTR